MNGETVSKRRKEIHWRQSFSPLWRVALPAPGHRELCCFLLVALVWMAVPPSPAHAVQSERRVEPTPPTVGFGDADSLSVSTARERVDVATPVAHVSMMPQLADNLALLFEKFGESEFVVCVEGALGDADHLQLRDFRMPHHAYSSSTSAGVYPTGDCRQYAGIIGTLHNHPENVARDSGPERENCYLSRMDIVSWLEHSPYQFTLVMCGPRLWAWWHRSQIEPTANRALPLPGQLLGPTSTDSRVETP